VAKDYSIIQLRGDINPWERQEPHESELMYSRFLVYRDLGPETDRLRQTLEVLTSTGDKLSYQSIRDYSSAFRWSARAAAWDRYRTQADRSRMIKLRREAIDDQRRTARALRLQALAALHAMNVEDLSPADVARFVELSFKIEKSVFDEFSETSVVNADAAENVDVTDIAAWSPAERRRRLELLRDELTKRAVRAADDDEVVA
jgi:hypothetical protein